MFTVDYTLFYTSCYILSPFALLLFLPVLINIISHIVRVHVRKCLYIRVARYCFFANMQIYSSLCFVLLVYTCRGCKKPSEGLHLSTKHCKHINSRSKNRARKIRLLGWERKSEQSKIKLGLIGVNPEW